MIRFFFKYLQFTPHIPALVFHQGKCRFRPRSGRSNSVQRTPLHTGKKNHNEYLSFLAFPTWNLSFEPCFLNVKLTRSSSWKHSNGIAWVQSYRLSFVTICKDLLGRNILCNTMNKMRKEAFKDHKAYWYVLLCYCFGRGCCFRG